MYTYVVTPYMAHFMSCNTEIEQRLESKQSSHYKIKQEGMGRKWWFVTSGTAATVQMGMRTKYCQCCKISFCQPS